MSSEQPTNDVVVSGSTEKKSGRRRLLLIVVALVPVLVLALWYFWPTDTGPKVEPQKAFEQAEELKNRGNFSDAAEYAMVHYKQAKTDKDKFQLAVQVATSYEANEEYEKAIEWYEKAAGHRAKDPASAAGMARSYDAMGNKKKAAEYYQKTLDWYDRSNPGVSDPDIAKYEALLKKAQE